MNDSDDSNSGSALQDEEFHEWLRRHGLDKPHDSNSNSGGYITGSGMITLPPGYTVNPAAIRASSNHIHDDHVQSSSFGWIPISWDNDKPEPKCTCGVTITMGKDDSIVYHSDYCDLKVKK